MGWSRDCRGRRAFRGIDGMRHLFLTAIVAAFLMPAVPAQAQRPAYEPDLLRLAEVLGSVHYLRNLCGKPTTVWRDEMTALISAENPDPETKARLTASFNRGYRAYAGVYTTCTVSAVAAIKRFMKEGKALSSELVTRYGN
jgi:uncharacterized protein (TIGR02301 family)